jgi:hypothetical protein
MSGCIAAARRTPVTLTFPVGKRLLFPTRKVTVQLMTTGVTNAEARAALDEIERSRRQVIDEIGMPRWYWWGLALGWIALGFLTDLHHPWLTASVTLAFGGVHASVSRLVIGGRHRTTQLSVHAHVAGRYAPLVVLAGLVGLGALTVVGAVAASSDGARHPVTTASIGVAVLIVLGGPLLMAAIRRRAVRSSASS